MLQIKNVNLNIGNTALPSIDEIESELRKDTEG